MNFSMNTQWHRHQVPFCWLLTALVLAYTAFAMTPTQVRAHDPSLHGFNLVPFKKPFTAPQIELTDLDGELQTLDSHKGKFVLLNFWATWCPPCLEEMPSMQVLHERYDGDDLIVVAVSSDEEGREIVAPYIEKLDVNFPVWLDTEGVAAKAYGAKNLPITFLLNRDGEVIAAATGKRDWASAAALSTLDEIVNQP